MKKSRPDLPEPGPIAPKESPSHKILLKLAKEENQDVDLLRDILFHILAHDHLEALPSAFRTIRRILELAPEIWHKDLNELGIFDWRPLLDWVINSEAKLTKEIGPHFGKKVNTSGKNPLSGTTLSKYPFYAVFCEIFPRRNADQFGLLIGQLLIAHSYALRDESAGRLAYEAAIERPWKALPNGIEVAARAVRRYSEEKKADGKAKNEQEKKKEALRERLNQELGELKLAVAPEHFVYVLEALPVNEDSATQNEREGLIGFLDKAYGAKDWVERNGGAGGGGGGGGKWVGGSIFTSRIHIGESILFDEGDDPSDRWGEIDIVSSRTGTHRERKALLDSDLSPDEDDSDEYTVLSDLECKDTRKGLGTLARIAKAKSRHLEKSNQKLPWDYLGLAVEEMAQLRVCLREQMGVLKKKLPFNKEDQLRAETILLIYTMLWVGTPAKEAVNIKVHFGAVPNPLDEVGVVCEGDKYCWAIPAFSPPYRSILEVTPSQVRELTNSFHLPCWTWMSPYFQNVLGTRGANQKTVRLFETPSKALLDSVDQWFKHHYPDGRINPQRVANSIWENMALHYGDPTMASCATGRVHHLAKVRIYYTSASVGQLQAAYEKVLMEMATVAKAAAHIPDPLAKLWMPEVEAKSLASGARMCPTVGAVKELFSKLVADIKLASKYADLVGYIQFHNLYTLYVLQYFAYSTTCRAIKTPYLDLKHIDVQRGLAALTDKDDGTHHKSRLVWLPEKLIAQMQFYEKHLHRVRERSIAQNSNKRILALPCFFLNEEGNPIEARPKVIEEHLKCYLNVKANTHRRFLRTELIERGCLPEAVDACMGHWIIGEAPHGQYSSFNFGQYIHILKEAMQKLHAQIGLSAVIQSPLAR